MKRKLKTFKSKSGGYTLHVIMEKEEGHWRPVTVPTSNPDHPHEIVLAFTSNPEAEWFLQEMHKRDLRMKNVQG
jgi:hypothetical protein